MDKNYKKELQYKGNSVKRCVKEYLSYVKEVEKVQGRIDTLKAENADEYDINKSGEYLEESNAVKLSARNNLRKFTDELTALINEIQDEETKKLEEYKLATEQLDLATGIFENEN